MKTEWTKVSLDELLRLERRPVDVLPDLQYQEIGIYCFGRGIFHKTPRTGLEVGDKNLFLLRKGDFILQVTFAWEGAIAIVSPDEDGMFASTRYPTFRVTETRCEPQFLLQYFQTEDGLQQIVKICPGSAGRNRVLSIKRLSEVLVPLPSLLEQRRTVAQIEQVTAQVNEARALREQSTEEASALTHSFLSELLRTARRKARWPLQPLGEIAEINPGRGVRQLSEDMQVSFVPMRSVSEDTGKIVSGETRTYAEVKTGYTRFEDGDIIFARITPCMQNGKSAIAEKLVNGTGFGSTEFHVIRPGPTVSAKWIHHLVRHREFLEDAAAHFTGTAGQQRVPTTFMREKRILVPPMCEQHRIVSELDELQAEADALRRLQAETSAELDALIPSIRARAFRGEL